MAFGTNPFPTYQPIYYAQPNAPTMATQPTPTTTPVNNSSIIWVQGEAGAKSYLVAPNTTVQLWDSEAPVIYLKSADASGMPTIKYLDYSIRTDNQSAHPPVKEEALDYATKEDIEQLQKELDALRNNLKAVSNSKRSYSKRREVTDNE